MNQQENANIIETTVESKRVFDGLILHIDHTTNRLPNGKLDSKDEDRLLAAKRELREETGLTAGSWTHLTDLFTTPGFSDERISLYLARDLSYGESHPDEDEFLNVVRVPLAQLVADIMAGEVNDAKTVCAVLMADRIING